MKALRYAVIGTGAIGGYYGGVLAKAGKEVHFLLHSDYAYVKERGLQVDSVDGDFHLDKVNAYAHTEDMPSCDVVIVCLKTTRNSLLKTLLPPLLHEGTRILLIQNGIGVEKEVASMFPDLNLAAGIAYVCSGKVGPGHIHHQDLGKIQVAPYINKEDEVWKQVVEDLKEAGVPASLEDYAWVRWRKSVWNIPFNGLTVVLNTTTDKIVRNPAASDLVCRIIREVVEAANACGCQLSSQLAEETVEMTRKMVPYSPSMKLDYDFHRPMEIQYLYTNAILEAEVHGVKVPLIKMLEQELRFIEAERK